MISHVCLCYLDDFLGHRLVKPLESFPVSDEQLKHIAGCLGHHFVPKLNKQIKTNMKKKARTSRGSKRLGSSYQPSININMDGIA